MTRSIPTVAAAFLLTAIGTPLFAQAAIQEPGVFSFYHPNADVLAGRGGYRSFDQSNAYYNSNTYYNEVAPLRGQQQVAPRRHRKAR